MLSFHQSQWAEEIGKAGAILKFNGQDNDYVKGYVESEMSKAVEVKGDFEKLIAEGRKAYAAAIKSLNDAKHNGRWAANSASDDGFVFFYPEYIDQVASAQWLKRHFMMQPAKQLPIAQQPYARNAFYC